MQNESHSVGPGDEACSRRPARGRRRQPKSPAKSATPPPSLAQAVEALPASRDAVVPKARKLVRDPGYPSDATLHLIAQLFISHLDLDEKSS